jgi:hypothetical protein
MWYRIIIVSAFVFLGFAASVTNSAESNAVHTIAGILMKLEHFPTDADKASLKQILEAKSATKDERIVAEALMNVQHKAADADKPKLEAIVQSEKAAGSVKTIASILLNLSHVASASDKEKLKALTF